MALSSRELLLVLRARDEASRVVRSFGAEFAGVDAAAQRAGRTMIGAGSAMVSVGVGIGGVGVATLATLKSMTDEAVEFNKKVAQTSTQLDKVAGSQEQLADIIKRTGREIAVPIDELHQGLFDIFSSMDVNVPQSEMLLKSFSKEAVAGQVELKEAARSTIGIMNAFHMRVEDVTRVQDVQFQLVRKGVGTYEEFARVMGRATPSAARAGQSVEMLSGMLAYLTRNGMSAAMAAASAGRAFDAFAHPKTVGRLEKMGIQVRDAQGNFRKFSDVIVDLQKHLSNMTVPERAEALQDLFKGSGGTIQARRFYDAVLKDTESVNQFVTLVGDMENASGAFENAYATMSETTAAKSQVVKNNWELMRIEIGQALIPALEKLQEIIMIGLTWWNSLDEGLRKQIVTWVAIGAAIAVAFGLLVIMAGGFLMLAGAAAMVGIGVGALIGIFFGVIAGIGLIIVAVILLVKHWDQVTQALASAWNWLWNTILKPVIDWIWDVIGSKLVALWDRVSNDIISGIRAVGDWFKRIWDMILTWTKDVWPGIKAVVGPIIDWFIGVWPFVKNAIGAVLKFIVEAFDAAWTIVVGVLEGAWIAISGIVEGIIKIIMGIIDFIVGIFTADWDRALRGLVSIFVGIWDIIKGIVLGVWEAIKGIVVGAIQFLWSLIKNGFEFVVNIIRTVLDGLGRLWNQFWSWFGQIISDIWGNITKAAQGFWDLLKKGFQGAVDGIKWIWDGLVNILKAPINFVIEFIWNKGLRWLWNKIADFIGFGTLPEAAKLADGGPVRGPGGPRSDVIPALLSNGEYVMPADKTARYYPYLEAMRRGGKLPGFADGGFVSNVISWVGGVAQDVINWVTDPIGSVTKAVGSTVKAVTDVAKVPLHLIGKAGEYLWNKLSTPEFDQGMMDAFVDPNASPEKMITAMQAWARAQKGKKYLWGAVGPNQYDCSGLVGNLYAMVMGKPLYKRYFTTASNFSSLGFMPGAGYFTVYLNKQGGHMAADLKGLHAEAYGGNGTPLAIGRVGTPLSFYNQILHLFADGGFVDMKHNPVRRMQSFLASGWPEPVLFDGGGVWKHGQLGLNMSGGDEFVLNKNQTRSLLGGSGGRSGGGDVTVHVYTQEIDPRKHAAELGWEIKYGRVV